MTKRKFLKVGQYICSTGRIFQAIFINPDFGGHGKCKKVGSSLFSGSTAVLKSIKIPYGKTFEIFLITSCTPTRQT